VFYHLIDLISTIGTTPLVAAAPMPSCTMRIFISDSNKEMIAQNVKIGDRLTLLISIDYQSKDFEILIEP
jgi:cuticlin, putative (fragment)